MGNILGILLICLLDISSGVTLLIANGEFERKRGLLICLISSGVQLHVADRAYERKRGLHLLLVIVVLIRFSFDCIVLQLIRAKVVVYAGFWNTDVCIPVSLIVDSRKLYCRLLNSEVVVVII